MNPDTYADGALAACTACAVQLGADPVLASILAGLGAVAIRAAVAASPALLERLRPAKRTDDSTAP